MGVVYSTDKGRLCPNCRQPVGQCRCRKAEPSPIGDGVARIQRQTGGRGGKTVTVITGLLLDPPALQMLCKELKQRCGSGGAVKAFTLEIQGDHRELLKAELEKRGFRVKLAGG